MERCVIVEAVKFVRGDVERFDEAILGDMEPEQRFVFERALMASKNLHEALHGDDVDLARVTRSVGAKRLASIDYAVVVGHPWAL